MSLSRLLILTAATFALAGGAQAFTIEGGPGSNGPSTNWKDLDLPKARGLDLDSRFSTENGRTEFKTGSGSFYFGNQQSFDQKYNPSNLFDPYAREGRY
jgi:hypothetical protein